MHKKGFNGKIMYNALNENLQQFQFRNRDTCKLKKLELSPFNAWFIILIGKCDIC